MMIVIRNPMAAALALGLLLQGCGPVREDGAPGEPAARECRRIGTLRVLGDGDVRINGRRAADGGTVCDGDALATGARSSVYVFFEPGGFVQLDERTDPIFRLIRELVFEIVGVDRGQMFAEAPPGGHLITTTPDSELRTEGTRLNVQVSASRTVLTVIDGRARLLRPPAGVVAARQQVGIQRGSLVSRRTLTAAELAEVMAWRDRYPLRGDAPTPDTASEPPSWLAPAIITGIGILVGTQLLDDDDDDRPQERPNDYDREQGNEQAATGSQGRGGVPY
jgi:hypothetical protein